MPQAYAVLYANDGSFLLAYKPALVYYFGDGTNGNVYPAGVAPNGANNYAFPGGRMNPGETLAVAAEREFFEETAYVPPDDYAVITHQFSTQYGAAYFRAADAGQVNAYATTIAGSSLPNSWFIAGAIYRGEITAYNQIAQYANTQGLNPWTHDNELYTVNVFNILNPATWAWVQTWANPASGIDWYYYILAYLRQTILNVPLAAEESVASAPTIRLRDGSRIVPPPPREPVLSPTGEPFPPPPFA